MRVPGKGVGKPRRDLRQLKRVSQTLPSLSPVLFAPHPDHLWASPAQYPLLCLVPIPSITIWVLSKSMLLVRTEGGDGSKIRISGETGLGTRKEEIQILAGQKLTKSVGPTERARVEEGSWECVDSPQPLS
jgi:hypothetical protein